jgi:alkylhydroperoxidase family enzyme
MFLSQPPDGPDAQRLYDEDRRDAGFVMNGSRLWAHAAELHDGLFALLGRAASVAGLSVRQRGILVTAAAATLGDSYCALAWGTKLGGEAGGELAAAVLQGRDDELPPQDRALARWARCVVEDPNATRQTEVQELRDAGFTEVQVLAVTAYVALRLAFSTVNDALGVRPEAELVRGAPDQVREAVTWGRGAEEWRRGESNP